ncbi:thermonuclease family protein [Terracoccus luteus]|uniref:thermonuclease family protein n=1 Tax=Terracoccus luteus TaxID=53356 RepID=UPI000EADAD1D|nr:thermonuclease family protein [Terracoccus luteus]
MATRRASARDGIISMLVVVVAGGFWWWTSRTPDDLVSADARPTASATPHPTTAKPTSVKPTTVKPPPPGPTSTRPASPRPTSTYTPPSFAPVKAGRYPVRRVSDGDTFSIDDATGAQLANVRIIGLNAPEIAHGVAKAECYGPQAAAELRRLLAGTTVTLVDDPRAPMFDRYGRRLAYVEVGGRDVATLMIRGGWATELHLPSAGPSVRTPTYLQAQAQAQREKRGLWGACPARPDATRAT